MIRKTSLRQKIVAHINDDTSLPAFPAVLQKANSLLTNPNVHLDHVADVIEVDPSLTAKFLRLANSAAYSGGAPITTLNTALVRIGLFDIKKMTIAAGALNAFKRIKVSVEWEKFWLHSLLTARTTEMLANTYGQHTGREYLAGLLHNLGAIFIQQYFPQEFETIVIRSMKNQEEFRHIQHHVLDMTYAEISSMICEKWEINPAITQAIRFHENLSVMPADNPKIPRLLAICLSLSSSLARMIVSDTLVGKVIDYNSFQELPELRLLQKFTPTQDLKLDIEKEAKEAEAILSSLADSPGAGHRRKASRGQIHILAKPAR